MNKLPLLKPVQPVLKKLPLPVIPASSVIIDTSEADELLGQLGDAPPESLYITALAVPNEPHNAMFDKLRELENALITNHPQMRTLLKTIHKQLLEDPAIVTLLSEQDIGIIVQSLTFQANVEFAEVTKPKAKSGKNVSLADLL